MEKRIICGLAPEEIQRYAGIPDMTLSHAVSVTNSLYKKRIRDIMDFPKLTLKLKGNLNNRFSTGLYDPLSFITSADGTVKYVFRSSSGLVFETVYIPDNKRNTICVSSQSGCRMGCHFCATASLGFRGDLSAGDMINQVISLPDPGDNMHVVFMGMGEPLDNIDNLLKACQVLTAEWGLALSPRNITVSTVGIIPGLERFLLSSECNLAFSLYSPFPAERVKAVPAEKRNPAAGIVELLKNYPLKKKRRLSVAYIMIRGVNDTPGHLQGLKDLLKGSSVRVNLVPYHPVAGDDLVASPPETLHFFKHELVISGISASVRKSRGADISAACGLLASTAG